MTPLLTAATLALAALTPALAATETPKMPTVLVTGSNRGLGLEFARQYAERGWMVIATARDPAGATDLATLAAKHPNARIETLDVTRNDQVDALAAKYRGQPIDVLLHNAGWLGDRDEQSLTDLDVDTFEEVMRINTYAPLRISQAFLEHVAASDQKKIVAITSGLSSITNTIRFGNLYFYRISKAGLNMGMRTLQAEVRARGIRVGILAPGVVETRLLRQSGWQGPAQLQPAESVAAVIRNIDQLDGQDAKFILFDGTEVPW
jgi:NAD(P)-dependent dehydrogenase (short-subunit alcohol dehydrogenase family)